MPKGVRAKVIDPRIAGLDIDKIYTEFNSLPDIRILVEATNGPEGCWGKDLGAGLYALNNQPLNPQWRYHDIVDTQIVNSKTTLIHRRWNTHMAFSWMEFAGEAESLVQREEILHAFSKADRAMCSFFTKGFAFASFEKKMYARTAVQLLRKTLKGVCRLGKIEVLK